MIKLEHVVLASPEQMEFIIEGMRNPMNSWEKSDSGVCLKTLPCHSCSENRNNCKKNMDSGFVIGENDHSLMQSLSDAGTDHRKYMRMMPVYVRIKAPLYWWKEFDTYKVGTVTNSCSTMHKIAEKEFTMEDFSTENLVSGWPEILKDGTVVAIPGPHEKLESTIELLNMIREVYLYISNTPKEEIDYSKTPCLTPKEAWWQMIQLLPSSYNQTRNVMLNYEVLTNIYHARKNHKLDEWRKFCGWIESLPYSELITGALFKVGDKVKYVRKGSIYYGKEGYIVEVEPEKIARVQIPIQLTSGDGFTTIPCSFDNLKHVENKEK